MAALSKRLARAVAKGEFATAGLASKADINPAILSGTRSEIYSQGRFPFCAGDGWKLGGNLADGGGHFHGKAVNPAKLSKVLNLIAERSCFSGGQTYASESSGVALKHYVARGSAAPVVASSRARHVRAISTAVSAEDKPKAEDEDEDLDSKAGEEDDLVADGEIKDGEEEEIAGKSTYTSAKDPTEFTRKDINTYFNLSPEDTEHYFPEGFSPGLRKEFLSTKENAFLIRARVLQLFKRFQKCRADEVRWRKKQEQGLQQQQEPGETARFFASNPRQCLLEGYRLAGKSAALTMLVHWARAQGWLVFFVPNGREWTSTGMYVKNEETGLYDTPMQAKTALEGFLQSHRTLLGDIPSRILEPIRVGAAPGIGKARGQQQILLPKGGTLLEMVERGIAIPQAAVGCLVRLREEFNLVQEVPVLIAVDEYNSWFTFSSFHESTGPRSRRPVHARELSMVNAFRSMEGPLMMATAFSHSLSVGRLPVKLPGVPKGVRFDIPRYTLEEATAALKYYYSRKITFTEPTEKDIKKLYYLTNGNAEELRNLVRLI